MTEEDSRGHVRCVHQREILLHAVKCNLTNFNNRVVDTSGHQYSYGITGSVHFAIVLACYSMAVCGTFWPYRRMDAHLWSIPQCLSSAPSPSLSPLKHMHF